MDVAAISAVVSEVAPLLKGRAPGKIFQLSPHSLAIDFGLRTDGYLFMSAEPSAPRLYLIKRRLRDLEKLARQSGPFALNLRKELAQTTLTLIERVSGDRVVSLRFEGVDELGRGRTRVLIAQLTGRSANLFILNDADVITARIKESKGAGQSIGEKYQPPPQTSRATPRDSPISGSQEFESVSAGLDAHYSALAEERAKQARLTAARAQLTKDISRRRKLLKQLERDLDEHSSAEQHKRIGDLLLANIATAKPVAGRVRLTDYFAEGTPEIEVEIDERMTIAEAASRRFELYSRSKRARVQIARRIELVRSEIEDLESRLEQLETSPDALAEELPPLETRKQKSGKPRETRVPGARCYVSSDGYEILVGRRARDNDNLTFKIAKPNDLWLHAADYPGSHVIVRNPTRKEIPHRTLVEAAQLAAYFSQAAKDPKVDVHYTERKFLSKPKGAAPGLVRMSRFKSLAVAPRESVKRA